MAFIGELTANGGYTAETLTLTHLLHCPCRQCRAFPWLRDTRPLSSLAGRCSAIHWLPGCISHCCCRNPDNPLGIRTEQPFLYVLKAGFNSKKWETIFFFSFPITPKNLIYFKCLHQHFWNFFWKRFWNINFKSFQAGFKRPIQSLCHVTPVKAASRNNQRCEC